MHVTDELEDGRLMTMCDNLLLTHWALRKTPRQTRPHTDGRLGTLSACCAAVDRIAASVRDKSTQQRTASGCCCRQMWWAGHLSCPHIHARTPRLNDTLGRGLQQGTARLVITPPFSLYGDFSRCFNEQK